MKYNEQTSLIQHLLDCAREWGLPPGTLPAAPIHKPDTRFYYISGNGLDLCPVCATKALADEFEMNRPVNYCEISTRYEAVRECDICDKILNPKEEEEAFQPAVVMESDLGEPVKKDDLVDCPAGCGQKHPAQPATTSDGAETDVLLFVNCNGKSFAVGIDGRRWK